MVKTTNQIMSWYVVFFLTQTPSPWNNCGIAFSARNAKAAFVIMETVEDAKWIVENVNGTLAFAAGVWVKHGIPTDPQKTGVFLDQISSYILILCFRLGIFIGCDGEFCAATWPHFDYLMDILAPIKSYQYIPIILVTSPCPILLLCSFVCFLICPFR